jgi:hypothetical protein
VDLDDIRALAATSKKIWTNKGRDGKRRLNFLITNRQRPVSILSASATAAATALRSSSPALSLGHCVLQSDI